MSRCVTYQSRYSMYTDKALGVVYRRAIVDPALKQARDRALANTANRTLDGSGSTLGAPSRLLNVKGPGYTFPKLSPTHPNYSHPLMGRRRPATMTTGDWEDVLRKDVHDANENADLLGPSSYPDWRKLMDACVAQR